MVRTLAEARRLDVSPDRLQQLGGDARVEWTSAVRRRGMADHRWPAAIFREPPPTLSPPRAHAEIRFRGEVRAALRPPRRHSAIRTRAALARDLGGRLDLRQRLHRRAEGEVRPAPA